jgi:glycosyltransferase involved in cell wall biosynthesis
MLNSPIEITKHHWPNNTKPLVTVCNWVYNHKDFIRQSIDSILMQKTTFPVEIIIQDDASNDGTREIIEQYALEYPDLFNNILFEKNQYSQGKDITNGLLSKASGRYIALTHGDDYWTDPYKLQKQVDFLEANSKCQMVCSAGMVKYEDSADKQNIQKMELFNSREIYDSDKFFLKHILTGNLFLTCSSMYRTVRFKEIHRILESTLVKHNIRSGDFLMQVLSICHDESNYIFCFDDVSVVYRKHEGGISNSIFTNRQKYAERRIVFWTAFHSTKSIKNRLTLFSQLILVKYIQRNNIFYNLFSYLLTTLTETKTLNPQLHKTTYLTWNTRNQIKA